MHAVQLLEVRVPTGMLFVLLDVTVLLISLPLLLVDKILTHFSFPGAKRPTAPRTPVSYVPLPLSPQITRASLGSS